MQLHRLNTHEGRPGLCVPAQCACVCVCKREGERENTLGQILPSWISISSAINKDIERGWMFYRSLFPLLQDKRRISSGFSLLHTVLNSTSEQEKPSIENSFPSALMSSPPGLPCLEQAEDNEI